MPGPPPRTSIEATAGSSNTIAVTPEASRGVVGMADPDAGDIGDQVAHAAIGPERGSAVRIIDHADHIACEGSVAPACIRRPSPSHLAAMAADVSILAALFAGLVSFLSPCVLPLVPPYLVYLAGASLERLADARADAAGASATTVVAALPVRGRVLHGVRRARRQRQRDRRAAARLFRTSSRSSPASPSSSWGCTSSGSRRSIC